MEDARQLCEDAAAEADAVLIELARPARLTFRVGEGFKPLAIAAVTIRVQGEAD